MAVDPPTLVGAARHLFQQKAWFPLENPAILSVPLGFLGAILGTLLTKEPSAEVEVQRAAGPLEHRTRCGESDGSLIPAACASTGRGVFGSDFRGGNSGNMR